nr:glycoside hydrolase family 43 protein [Salinibacterium sp.]
MSGVRRMRRGAALLAAAGLLLTGCAASESPAGETEEPASRMLQPVIKANFPDPDVLEVDGRYYAYATNDNAKNVQFATSDDLEEWEVQGADALPELPSWIIPGKTWAPEVSQVGEAFVMYFTASNFSPSVQCIGVATADAPEGPFEVVGGSMLVCPEEEGGAIDASTAMVAGQLHLVWKNDGNCCGLDTWLQAAPLTADGLALAGAPARLIKQDLEWEGDLVEAPTILERDGQLVLLYSANSYGDDRYAIGAATAPALEGPWTKFEQPVLSTTVADARLLGPGGQDVVAGPDGDVLVFHGWDPAFSYRAMFTLPLEWDGARPVPVLDGE